jgi:hypothetical protein
VIVKNIGYSVVAFIGNSAVPYFRASNDRNSRCRQFADTGHAWLCFVRRFVQRTPSFWLFRSSGYSCPASRLAQQWNAY